MVFREQGIPLWCSGNISLNYISHQVCFHIEGGAKNICTFTFLCSQKHISSILLYNLDHSIQQNFVYLLKKSRSLSVMGTTADYDYKWDKMHELEIKELFRLEKSFEVGKDH